MFPRVASFHSRLGRRMLFTLFLCALVPVCTLAFLSYNQVTGQLHEQSRARLWSASKSLGMTIYERLLFLEANLDAIERDITLTRKGAGSRPAIRVTKHIEGRFEAITLIANQGDAIALLGTPGFLPALSYEDVEYIRSGNSLILTQSLPGAPPRILMLRAHTGKDRDDAILIARIKPSYLWGGAHENNLPPSSDYCVFSDPARMLFCSAPERGSLTDPSRSEVSAAASGYLEWTIADQPLIAAYWSLFLKPRFRAGSWIVMVSEPRANALAPVADFHKTFPLTLALALCIVMLSSLMQIRRNLVPLAELQKGTRRIAKQDFDIHLDINSGDEFEELAQSFNSMAERLGQQFRLTNTRAEIDRAVLAAMDLSTIVDRVLTLVPKILPCDSLSLTVVDANNGSVAETYTQTGHDTRALGRELIDLTAEELGQLQAESDIVLIKATDTIPSYLLPLRSQSVASFVVLPLRFKQDLLGILAFALADDPAAGHERLAQVRSIADQLAIALSNVRMIQQIHVLAYYDSLTGLPNRTFYRERLQQALEDAERHQSLVAVLFVDLDSFKRINDTLGHDQGDELLRTVARRMRECARDEQGNPQDFGVDIARPGGDEFTLMLTDIRDAQTAAQVARRILSAISSPFTLASQELTLTASIGITIYPLDGDDIESLLKNADVAMYEAKNGGGDDFRFYRKSMNEEALRYLTIESKLRKALERNELLIHYQPIVDAQTGSIVGVEALLRWQDAELGLVRPDEFIGLAEASGLIVAFGRYVLRKACEQNVAWQSAGLPPITVSVNVSARQLKERSLVQTVQRALADSGLSPEHLVLEITESVLVESIEATTKVLQRLRSIGVKLSIDDFGTGYSSLSYLKHFAVNHLKIDKSFVQDIASSQTDAAIASGIIAMGHSLGLKVIAEGVETDAQLELLRAAGCDEVQGFLFGRPAPEEAVAQLLREGTHQRFHRSGD